VGLFAANEINQGGEVEARRRQTAVVSDAVGGSCFFCFDLRALQIYLICKKWRDIHEAISGAVPCAVIYGLALRLALAR
jgi:hypothetical protein